MCFYETVRYEGTGGSSSHHITGARLLFLRNKRWTRIHITNRYVIIIIIYMFVGTHIGLPEIMITL